MPAAEADTARTTNRTQAERLRSARRKKRRGLRAAHFFGLVLLGLAHAVCIALMYPTPNVWPLAFVAPIPLAMLALHARSKRLAMGAVLLTQWPLWMWMHAWAIDVTLAGWPLLGLAMSLYTVLFVLLFRRVAGRRTGRQTYRSRFALRPALKTGQVRLSERLPLAVTLPAVWVGVEFFRGELAFNGYPWFLLGHPLVEWPLLAQSADLFGAYLTSFIAATAGGALLDVWRSRRGAARGRTAIIGASIAAGVVIANLAYGAIKVRGATYDDAALSILIVQTNLPQNNKIAWKFDDQVRDVSGFIDQTIDAYEAALVSGGSVDLIAWPETMLPGFGFDEETVSYAVANRFVPGDLFTSAIESLANDELQTPMLIGSGSYEGLRVVDGKWEWDRHYNSVYLIWDEPPFPRYDKLFLTPFGEVMPYISAWPWLEQRFLSVAAPGMGFDVDTGSAPVRFMIETADRAWRIATPICFEDAMSRVCRQLVWEDGEKRVDVLVNLSNDGWFGDSEAARRQHAQIARFRAIENRVPLVRAANTGCSVSIDAYGFVVASIGEGRYGTGQQSGSLLAHVRANRADPLFARVGNLWGWLCLILTLALLVAPLTRGKETQ